MNKFLVVDGHNYLFRAYYGVPMTARTKLGNQVNAVYGFFAFLRRATKEISPDFLCIVFDSETGIALKQNILGDYKKNRKYNDTGMFSQLRMIKSILANMGVAHIEDPSVEADDLIGSIGKSCSNLGISAYISSNDYDFFQLVSENIYVVRQVKGLQDIFNQAKVFEKYGILPGQYLDYIALRGDISDNVRGVKGIGTKTAIALIQKYNSIENLLAHAVELPSRQHKMLYLEEENLLSRKKFLRIDDGLTPFFLEDLNTYKFNLETINENVNSCLHRIGVD